MGSGQGGFPETVRRFLLRRSLDVYPAGGDGADLRADFRRGIQIRAAGAGALRAVAGSGNRPLVFLQRGPEYGNRMPAGVQLSGKKSRVSCGSAADYQAFVLCHGSCLFRGDHVRREYLLRLVAHGHLDSGDVLLLCSRDAGPGTLLFYQRSQRVL